MSSSPVFVGTPSLGLIQLNSTINSATLFTGGNSGSKVVSIICTSTDTANQTIQVALNRSSNVCVLGSFPVLAGSGTNGTTPSVSLLANSSLLPGLPIDNDGQNYIFLANTGDTITITSTANLTSAKIISAFCIAGNF